MLSENRYTIPLVFTFQQAILADTDIKIRYNMCEVKKHLKKILLLLMCVVFGAYCYTEAGFTKAAQPKYKLVEVELEQEMMVQATAYWTHDPVDASGHGIAYDGTPAVAYKTIAVDPKVIPLQSQVYVPGFGWMRANDTGNAIKGAIIDIAMPNREEAWKWGRRNILVKIRPPKPQKVQVWVEEK